MPCFLPRRPFCVADQRAGEGAYAVQWRVAVLKIGSSHSQQEQIGVCVIFGLGTVLSPPLSSQAVLHQIIQFEPGRSLEHAEESSTGACRLSWIFNRVLPFRIIGELDLEYLDTTKYVGWRYDGNPRL
jgi:hypothetical protein